MSTYHLAATVMTNDDFRLDTTVQVFLLPTLVCHLHTLYVKHILNQFNCIA